MTESSLGSKKTQNPVFFGPSMRVNVSCMKDDFIISEKSSNINQKIQNLAIVRHSKATVCTDTPLSGMTNTILPLD